MQLISSSKPLAQRGEKAFLRLHKSGWLSRPAVSRPWAAPITPCGRLWKSGSISCWYTHLSHQLAGNCDKTVSSKNPSPELCKQAAVKYERSDSMEPCRWQVCWNANGNGWQVWKAVIAGDPAGECMLLCFEITVNCTQSSCAVVFDPHSLCTCRACCVQHISL